MAPVYNEERALPGCLRVLRSFLDDQFPFEWTITVVDNASTDGVLQVASELAASDDRIRVLHLDRKGRGHALRTAWTSSDDDVVDYMDVDLSTGLDALLPLVIPLINGHSDVAIGSRLLLLAEHNGLRVHEVPVDWVEDVDSRVHVLSTAVADARGQLAAFGLIGVVSTVAAVVLYTLLRLWDPSLVANLVAVLLTACALGTAGRFALLRAWVFTNRPRAVPGQGGAL